MKSFNLEHDWLQIPAYENPFCDFEKFNEKEKKIANDLKTNGYAILDFPDPNILVLAEQIKTSLKDKFDFERKKKDSRVSLRVQDYITNSSVKKIAENNQIIDLLTKVYGRKAFPFQTLNFPMGTQQAGHSDHIHFDSIPHRFMAGVWVALEDIDENNGPLFYYPGSHNWPALTNLEIGYQPSNTSNPFANRFTQAWEKYASYFKVEKKIFTPKAGQCLIWSSNLVHGGMHQKDLSRTRWSQVTHYFFEDCAYHTPLFEAEFLGKYYFRDIKNLATGETVSNKIFDHLINQQSKKLLDFSSFDENLYLKLNPDVAIAGINPIEHFLRFGIKEGRKWR